jgi:maltodextrin utilization protein YvdJ
MNFEYLFLIVYLGGFALGCIFTGIIIPDLLDNETYSGKIVFSLFLVTVWPFTIVVSIFIVSILFLIWLGQRIRKAFRKP